ncbi:hypothetical protein SJ05684_c30200 [Sinorhizobium sojae CCBAU 05684]|uniref:Uncharacterized protein n=1 Tax=Sinorhizobium sojae CCBAU 05684 TaxID=716928 RepID=A0A249PFJ6_9HYPH|nr:hypothetical protein [Sinorhizobium sojae]ASY64444.1 hypothetical protein SJ05684_c30200 [Sinorhizobium sojae CCBAU 05684]
MITSSNMRAIMSAICSVDRHQIEAAGPISDKRWRDFQADPHGTFMKLNDRQQDAVTAAINRRISESRP